MSTQIEGVFPHDLLSYDDVELLPKRLQPAIEGLIPIWHSYWGRLHPPKSGAELAWHIRIWGPVLSGLTPRQQWESGKGPMLFAPEATVETSPFHLILGRRCLFANMGVKWWWAMDCPARLYEVRDYFRWLASALDSSAFILYREDGGLTSDWVCQGMTLEEIEREKVKHGAKKAHDIDALRYSSKKILKTRYYRESLVGSSGAETR